MKQYQKMLDLLFKQKRTHSEETQLDLLCLVFRAYFQGSRKEPIRA